MKKDPFISFFVEQCQQMLAYVVMEWTLSKGFEATGIAGDGDLHYVSELPSPDAPRFKPGDAACVHKKGVYALTRDKKWVLLFLIEQAMFYSAECVKAGGKVPTPSDLEKRMQELAALHQKKAAEIDETSRQT